jgi:hypothetical protein
MTPTEFRHEVSLVKLTNNQKSMLCLLDDTDGVLGEYGITGDLAHELCLSLETLGLVKRGHYGSKGWEYPPTELGRQRAAITRYRKDGDGCRSCVSVACVCRLSIFCIKDRSHRACHGSHD